MEKLQANLIHFIGLVMQHRDRSSGLEIDLALFTEVTIKSLEFFPIRSQANSCYST